MKKHLAGLVLAASVAAVVGVGCKHAKPPAPEKVEIGPVPSNSFVRQAVSDLGLKSDKVQQMYLRGDKLIVYTGKHEALLMSRDGLSLLASMDVTHPRTRMGAPVLLTDRVIFPTNTVLEVFSLDGKHVRTVDLGRALRSQAVGSEKTLYMGVDYEKGGRVIALDVTAEAAPIRWEFITKAGISASPAVNGNTVYVGTDDGRVIAAIDNGTHDQPEQLFTFQTDGRVTADLKADKDGVYVASTDTKLYCLDPGTGKIKWQYYSEHALTSSPIVTESRVYQAVPRVGLVALDKKAGQFNREPLWISDAVTQILAEDGQNLYARLSDNAIACIDKQTGQRKFESQRKDFSAFATNTKDAVIYAATKDGKIYALTPVFRGGQIGEVVRLDEREVPASAVASLAMR